MITLWILYILSVLISFVVFYKEYNKYKYTYEFTRTEKILGLVVIPLIPILNICLTIVRLS